MFGKKWYDKCFGEDCLDWFMNEMLEKEAYMKKCLQNDIEVDLDIIIARVANSCWLCEKDYKIGHEKKPNC